MLEPDHDPRSLARVQGIGHISEEAGGFTLLCGLGGVSGGGGPGGDSFSGLPGVRLALAAPAALRQLRHALAASCHHFPMSDEISGEIVPAPPAADMRYTDDTAVTRVFIRVDYADGRIREYEAREPQDFKMGESMTAREASFAISAGGLFRAPAMVSPALRLSFSAHPRWNLHVRTEATAPGEFEGITY
jgi:hypothetical protein